MLSSSKKPAGIIRGGKAASCSTSAENLPCLPLDGLGVLLDTLEDGILAEVLCRLPLKDVHQCKCVCKKWSALISSIFFTRRFIQHSSSQHPLMPFALLPSHPFTCKFYREIFISTDQCFATPGLPLEVFGPAGFSLSFLPEDVYIRGVSRDLLTCCNFESGMDYIVNPLTKNWVALPPPVRPNHLSGSLTCLICDPSRDDECDSRNVILATDYKYKVVRIFDFDANTPDFELQVFSSESGRWNSSIVSPGVRWILHHCAPVVFNGNVHWITRDHGILTCDLSSKKVNDEDEPPAVLRFMNRPTDGAQEFNECSTLGVFCGRLRTCNVIDLHKTPKLRVWELVDYDSGDWKLEFEVYMNEMSPDYRQMNNSDSGNFQERLKRVRWEHLKAGTKTVFHPHLGNIVYIWVDPDLFCCNLQSRTFKEFRWRGQIGMLPYILPRWPSPVPKPFPPPPAARSNSRARPHYYPRGRGGPRRRYVR